MTGAMGKIVTAGLDPVAVENAARLALLFSLNELAMLIVQCTLSPQDGQPVSEATYKAFIQSTNHSLRSLAILVVHVVSVVSADDYYSKQHRNFFVSR